MSSLCGGQEVEGLPQGTVQPEENISSRGGELGWGDGRRQGLTCICCKTRKAENLI